MESFTFMPYYTTLIFFFLSQDFIIGRLGFLPLVESLVVCCLTMEEKVVECINLKET